MTYLNTIYQRVGIFLNRHRGSLESAKRKLQYKIPAHLEEEYLEADISDTRRQKIQELFALETEIRASLTDAILLIGEIQAAPKTVADEMRGRIPKKAIANRNRRQKRALENVFHIMRTGT
jgi:hypothetical protein